MLITIVSLTLLVQVVHAQATNGSYIDVTTGQRSSSTAVHTSWERSLAECTVRCHEHSTCGAIEFQDSTGHCRMFSSLSTSTANATSPDAKYRQAQISTPTASSHANPVKHVLIPTTTFANSTTVTTVFTTTFVKKNASTGLRVTYSGSFGSYGDGCSGCNIKFHFTFNGSPCASPSTLDYAYYNSPAVSAHWPAVKDGICDNLAPGTVTVGVETAPYSTGTVPPYNIAFYFDSHLLIEEVYYPQNAPSTASVVGMLQSPMDTQTSAAPYTFKTFTYTKQAADTELLIFYSGNLRMSSPGGCARWYFNFNGQECAVPGNLGEMQALLFPSTNLLRGGIIGGVCSNLPAGQITIDFNVGSCPQSIGLSLVGTYTGSRSVENFVVEEVRLRMPNPSPEHPSFNVDFKHWTGGQNVSNGVITTFNYNKVSSNAALRFRFFGSLASIVPSGVGGSMWCFQIDGMACTNPAPACTALWSGFHTEHVRPYELLSVCQGVAAGTRAVSLVVKPLASGAGNAMTGWTSHAQNYLLVDEVFVV